MVTCMGNQNLPVTSKAVVATAHAPKGKFRCSTHLRCSKQGESPAIFIAFGIYISFKSKVLKRPYIAEKNENCEKNFNNNSQKERLNGNKNN